MSFSTALPIIEIAILSKLRRFGDCLEVEGWLKTGNKGHSFRAWLSLELVPTFLVVLLIRDKSECYLIKVITMKKLLILAAKMTKLWLGIVQQLVRWPPLFISLLQSACLREHLYKIWEKSIWYFYHTRATLRFFHNSLDSLLRGSLLTTNAPTMMIARNEKRGNNFRARCAKTMNSLPPPTPPPPPHPHHHMEVGLRVWTKLPTKLGQLTCTG